MYRLSFLIFPTSAFSDLKKVAIQILLVQKTQFVPFTFEEKYFFVKSYIYIYPQPDKGTRNKRKFKDIKYIKVEKPHNAS